MTQTPTISDLVRDGHASPSEGALLLELRRESEHRHHRTGMGTLSTVVIALGAFFIAFFARRSS